MYAEEKKHRATAVDLQEESDIDLSECQKLMEKAIDHLQHELANVRTGRATPGMLDHLKVDAYGQKLPLKAVGTVVVRDPQLLVVTVFDSNVSDAVVSSISQSPLQLNPRKEGEEIFVPIPAPTGEMLAAMGKLCKSEGEAAKISIRHARKEAMDELKEIASEDARHRLEKDVQALTDEFIRRSEEIVAAKQKDIKTHRY